MKKQEKFIFDVIKYLLSIGAKPNDVYIKGKKLIIPPEFKNFELSLNTKFGELNIILFRCDLFDKSKVYSIFSRFSDYDKCKQLTGFNAKYNFHYSDPLGISQFQNSINNILI